VNFTGSSGSNQWFINDIGSTSPYISDSSRVFALLGYPNINFSSTSSGEKTLINIANKNSETTLRLNKVAWTGTVGTNSLLYLGGKKIDAEILEATTNGAVICRIGVVSSIGSRNVYNRNANIRIGKSTSSGGGSSNIGAFRWQGSGVDSLSNIELSVGSVRLTTKRHSLAYFERANFRSVVSFSFGAVSQEVASATKINGYTTGVVSGDVDFNCDSVSGSFISVIIDELNSPNVCVGANAASTPAIVFDSTTVLISIKKGSFTKSSPFVIWNWTLRNGSKLIIDCEDCQCTGTQSAFWIFGNTIDATSFIELRGRYKVNGAMPVLNTRNEVILNNATFLNDGTVAAIQSDAATNVLIKSAYTNANVADDADVIFLGNTLFKHSSYK
jgi:hypothetical protein